MVFHGERRSERRNAAERPCGKASPLIFYLSTQLSRISQGERTGNPLIGRRVASLIKPVSRRHVAVSTCERNKQPNDISAIPRCSTRPATPRAEDSVSIPRGKTGGYDKDRQPSNVRGKVLINGATSYTCQCARRCRSRDFSYWIYWSDEIYSFFYTLCTLFLRGMYLFVIKFSHGNFDTRQRDSFGIFDLHFPCDISCFVVQTMMQRSLILFLE